MNKLIFLLIGVAVVGAAAMAGMFSPQPKNKNYTPISAKTSCVDHDPPSTTDTITLRNGQFNLIKDNAEVKEDFKFKEMRQIDQVGGKNVYSMGSDYFGQLTDPNLVFVLQNSAPFVSPYIFKIYLRDGIPIPDYIKNCKSTGGTIAVARDDVGFPPSAFNKTDIVGLSEPSVAPGYVYDRGPKITSAFVMNLPASRIGGLNISSRNTNLPLYFHLGTIYLVDGSDAYQYLPSADPIDLAQSNKSLQLKKITFVQAPSYSWWTPSCKPAIYLYPPQKENVNVRVNTTGHFTLTIPNYPQNGWSVVASPDGTIETESGNYPYLYYESEISDPKITKPTKGFVVAKSELAELFNNLLPKLGLNNKAVYDFKDYWEKALPNSSYYFVGVMDEKSIDSIEPLDINPVPDSINRVRLYFELLDKPKSVEKPVITTPRMNGFAVVEWGGMVKTDKNHPFTCSQ